MFPQTNTDNHYFLSEGPHLGRLSMTHKDFSAQGIISCLDSTGLIGSVDCLLDWWTCSAEILQDEERGHCLQAICVQNVPFTQSIELIIIFFSFYPS